MKFKPLIAAALLIQGCTSIHVKPVLSTANIQHVCIVNNPRVAVSDFISVLRDGFNRHGIATTVVEQSQAQACDVTLTYVAFRRWDFAPYLTRAELRLWRDGKQIGSADYRHKGGFALNKWRGTRKKMDPVIDQLLGG